ncbi:hypothetical protein MOQ72_15030 [Saccharopolyspora sp. K220]|uniref:hypothetical protein n=1 Tax=Saccharopolyspora soli TaxID=2926618 RepID=UPI001F56710F|nr:hypothetical protein [Saccharopolyspora soli]MCI2418753.1 hypothetical protein [Saccharopolyspora soli]
MSNRTDVPQTLTVMEACFTLAPGIEDEFWRAQDRFGPVAAAAPGFRGVIGGPIANSSWLYFGGVFDTPDHMDQWYQNRQHGAMQRKAHKTWFNSVYIRKWRLPAPGEVAEGRVFVETSIARGEALTEDEVAATLAALNESFPEFGPRRFETTNGNFEPNPYQFVGPLEEAPQLAPARYLLLTHWNSAEAAQRWLDSPAAAALGEIGEVDSRVFVPLYHAAGEREGLNVDGMHREWIRTENNR